MPLYTILQYEDKTIDLLQVTNKLYHKVLYRLHPAINWIQTHNISGDIYELIAQVVANQTIIRLRSRHPSPLAFD